MTPAPIFQNRNPHPGQEDLWTGASTELHPKAVGHPVRQVGHASFDPLSGGCGALNTRLPSLLCGRLPVWPISERNRCGARSWWEEQRAPGGREMGCYGGALLLLALGLHVSGESCLHAQYRRAAHFGRLDPILPLLVAFLAVMQEYSVFTHRASSPLPLRAAMASWDHGKITRIRSGAPSPEHDSPFM